MLKACNSENAGGYIMDQPSLLHTEKRQEQASFHCRPQLPQSVPCQEYPRVSDTTLNSYQHLVDANQLLLHGPEGWLLPGPAHSRVVRPDVIHSGVEEVFMEVQIFKSSSGSLCVWGCI